MSKIAFTIRISRGLCERLERAAARFETKTKTGKARTKGLVTALVETGLERVVGDVERGVSVLDSPHLRALRAVQLGERGEKIFAAPLTRELYEELREKPRPITEAERKCFLADAEAGIAVGYAARVRGNVFTQDDRPAAIGLTIWPDVISEQVASYERGGQACSIHVFDLEPA